MSGMRTRLARLSRIDRRVIYIVMAVAVIVPFLAPVRFHAAPSEETLQFVEALEAAIRSDRPVVVELAFGNQSVSEMEPIALALMHKLFHEKKETIFLTTYESAAAYTRRYLAAMEKEYGLTYGEDYVFLGYAGAYHISMYKMGTSIASVYHEDDRGTPIEEIPIMNGVESLEDASVVIDIASNANPRHWINFVVSPRDIDFIMGTTAVLATDYYPFLQTGQVKGLIAGGRAGAELETLFVKEGAMSRTGDATRNLGSQSLALFVILGFIILGNVGYFAGRKSGRRRRG